MIIKTWRDPYDAGFSPTRPTKIELHPGVTVLVGCNGAGKSTLLQNIKSECEHNNIPYHMFDNLADGGKNQIFSHLLAFGSGDYASDSMSLGVSMLESSEGEIIKIHLGRLASELRNFIITGEINSRSHRLSKIFRTEKPELTTDDRVLLFDATDSGVSIDAICEIKEFFNSVITESESLNKHVYIVIAANEFELARESDCFDVNAGKYIRFKDYEDYRAFILKSRQNKEKRILKQIEYSEKQAARELEQYEKLKAKIHTNIEKLENSPDISFSKKYKIEHLRDELEQFRRNCRYATIKEDE